MSFLNTSRNSKLKTQNTKHETRKLRPYYILQHTGNHTSSKKYNTLYRIRTMRPAGIRAASRNNFIDKNTV